jgi:uncharacterized protein (DUF58 family)
VGQKHDIVAIAVHDPRESALPSSGLVAVEDPETGERGLLDTGSRVVRAAYAARAEQERARLRDEIRRCGIDLFELSTGEAWETALVRFFHERARRVRRSGG